MEEIARRKKRISVSAKVDAELYEIIKRYSVKDRRTFTQAMIFVLEAGVERMGIK